MLLSKLCSKCQDLAACRWARYEGADGSGSSRGWLSPFVGAEEPGSSDEPLQYHTLEQLKASAASCHLCDLLYARACAGITRTQDLPMLERGRLELFEINRGTSYLVVQFGTQYVGFECFFKPYESLHDCALATSTDVIPSLTHDDEKLFRSDRSRVVENVQAWLTSCHNVHNKCEEWVQLGRQASVSTVGAARLLSISLDGLQVQIIDASALPPDTRYTTLSHRWGNHVPLKLTADSSSVLQAGILAAMLPATFRDAVWMTRQLGVGYIWIDALCILQDCPEDWSREAPKMTSIYSGSYVNLAATASPDARGGLFIQRPTFLTSVHCVSTRWSGLSNETGNVILVPIDSWETYVEKSALSRRGWILQERVLACRTLHFAEDQIWWECLQSCGCDMLPQGAEPPHTFEVLQPQRDLRWGNWKSIVEVHSALDLTFGADKLMALAGLARLFMHIHVLQAEDYLAGLWKRDFPDNLLYRAKRPVESDGGSYRAPSWSWASSDAEVDHHPSHAADRTLCEVTEACVIHSSGDPFGNIQDGILRCVGALHKVRPHLSPNREDTADTLHFANGRIFDERILWSPVAETRHGCVTTYYDTCTGQDSRFIADTYFLPVQYERRPFGQNRIWVYGLLLEPVAKHQAGTYRRLGVMDLKMDEKHWDQDEWSQCSLDKRLYHKAMGEGRYEITLI